VGPNGRTYADWFLDASLEIRGPLRFWPLNTARQGLKLDINLNFVSQSRAGARVSLGIPKKLLHRCSDRIESGKDFVTSMDRYNKLVEEK
jgi:hypothetical protein